MAVADLNGDGNADVVSANAGASTVSVLLGDGAGGFGPKTDFAVSFMPSSVAVGDFNGDGKLDLVTSNSGANAVSVLLGDGAGGFGPSADFGVGLAPVSVAVVDVNGDGKLDLVTANPGAEDLVVDNVSVLLGNGLGSFGNRTDFAVGVDPLEVAVGDLNGDGKPDLVTANFDDNTVTVLYNCTNVPLLLSTSASPNPVCAGASLALSTTVTGGSAPYSFTWAAPAGITLSATSTSAVSASVGAGVSGVQTFTLTAAASGGTPSSTSFVSVTVNAVPTNPSLSSGTLTCAQTSVTLTASATGGSSYTLNGGGGSQTNATGRFVVSSPGNYTTIIANANGCTAVASVSVSQNSGLVPPSLLTQSGQPYPGGVSSLTVTPNSPSVVLVAANCPGTLNWTGPNNASGTGSITVSTAQPGSFVYQATCQVGPCTSAPASATVTVNENSPSVVRYWLINAQTEQPLLELTQGTMINLAMLPSRELNIQAVTEPATVGSVVLELSGQQTRRQVESSAPYALFGDRPGDFLSWTPLVGSYQLQGTAYAGANGTGVAGPATTLTFLVVDQVDVGLQVLGFELIDARTDQPLKLLTDGEVVNLATLPGREVNIQAVTEPATVGSVVLELSGQQRQRQVETQAPYALFGNNGVDYDPWSPSVGSYQLTATAYAGANGTGVTGSAYSLSFRVVNQSGSPRQGTAEGLSDLSVRAGIG